MFFRARRALGRAWFNFGCRELLKTEPLVTNAPDITVVSMVCHGEVIMYLLAVKTFCRHLGRVPRIALLDDGSLTANDRATVRKHLPEAKIVPIAGVSTGTCPKGSCWERLHLIADLVKETYVVQLDCDTLTLDEVPEVAASIDANRSFSLMGDRSYAEVEPMLEACARAKGNPGPMVQAVCERNFDLLPEAAGLKYLRGNAGFSGFAKGSIDRWKIQWFSDLMRRVAKETWNQWGSEQVTSNLLIANTEGPIRCRPQSMSPSGIIRRSHMSDRRLSTSSARTGSHGASTAPRRS